LVKRLGIPVEILVIAALGAAFAGDFFTHPVHLLGILYSFARGEAAIVFWRSQGFTPWKTALIVTVCGLYLYRLAMGGSKINVAQQLWEWLRARTKSSRTWLAATPLFWLMAKPKRSGQRPTRSSWIWIAFWAVGLEGTVVVVKIALENNMSMWELMRLIGPLLFLRNFIYAYTLPGALQYLHLSPMEALALFLIVLLYCVGKKLFFTLDCDVEEQTELSPVTAS
jgi:hypothetical protein